MHLEGGHNSVHNSMSVDFPDTYYGNNTHFAADVNCHHLDSPIPDPSNMLQIRDPILIALASSV